MTPHGIGKEIVCLAGERRRLSSVELLCAGRSKRQYLHVDLSGIHFGDPLVSQLAELFQEFRRGAAEFQSLFFESTPRTIEESRTREMFLQGYRSHAFYSSSPQRNPHVSPDPFVGATEIVRGRSGVRSIRTTRPNTVGCLAPPRGENAHLRPNGDGRAETQDSAQPPMGPSQ